MQPETINIIVIGASAGGIPAVSRLLSGFKSPVDAAIFVVIHLPVDAMVEVILRQFQQQTSLNCVVPLDGGTIKTNTVYLAPSNHHLMITPNQLMVRKGPYENHWRPSIDVLFRTAAAAYSSCVTGIILTGLMNDGTSGMLAIKKSGGTVIVQDPSDADFPEMPESVLSNVEVDYTAPIHEIPYILTDLFSQKNCEFSEVPDIIKKEADITLRMTSDVADLNEIAEPTILSCPECGGRLSRIKDADDARYRCYTGHVVTEKILLQDQVKSIEESLWVAIRMMEERKNLLNSMEAYDVRSRRERARHLEIHIDRLKKILLEVNEEPGQNN